MNGPIDCFPSFPGIAGGKFSFEGEKEGHQDDVTSFCFCLFFYLVFVYNLLSAIPPFH